MLSDAEILGILKEWKDTSFNNQKLIHVEEFNLSNVETQEFRLQLKLW